MKYQHHFTPVETAGSTYTYHADETTLRLDFFENIVRVAVLRDGTDLFPTWSVCPDGICPKEGRDKLSTAGFTAIEPMYTEDEEQVSFVFGENRIDVNLFNFHMKVSNTKGTLFEDREYIAHNFSHELGNGTMHFITREAEEKIYGLGDKTGNVNKNKMSFKLSAEDAMGFDARSSDPLYKQVPFYICENSAGSYGIFYDTYANGEINFGKEINNYYAPFKSFRCDEENLVFYILFGDVPSLVRTFSWMCGPILFPPKWTLQYCGSTMAYTDAPDADAQLRRFADLCEEYGLHPGGFYMSSGYTQIGEKRYVFHWNNDKVPSPEDLSAYFKAHGMEFLPNIKPAFLSDHPLYEKIAEKGWFLHYSDGTPALFPFWSGYGSYLDFTNPEAYDFWRDCVKEQLIDKGFRNPWNDNNEYDINDEDVYAYGFGKPVQARLIRPLFSLLMTMSSLEAQDHSIRTMSVSRCEIAGHQRIATTWTGDNNTDFADFRYNHKMAMTMSLTGFYNFGQDIGGFAGPKPEEELFFRWIQYGIFTPRFVLHSWNPDGSSTMPWLYPDKMEQVKKLFHLRDRMVPYLYNELWRSVQTHDPIIYPIFLKYPEWDRECDAFFCGDSILACPVFDKGVSTVTVTLPENNGGWYYDERYYEGKHTLPCLYDHLPVYFVKGGSVLPEENGYVIYPKEDGVFTASFLYDDGVSNLTEDNHSVLHMEVICTPVSVDVVVDGEAENLRLVDRMNRTLNIIHRD